MKSLVRGRLVVKSLDRGRLVVKSGLHWVKGGARAASDDGTLSADRQGRDAPARAARCVDTWIYTADPGGNGESRREEGTCTQREHMTDSKRSLNLIIWARLFHS